MIDFNFIWIDVNCPKCKYGIQIQLIDVKNEAVIYCHNCKSAIHLKDNEASSYKGINDINSAFDKLNKTLKNLGK